MVNQMSLQADATIVIKRKFILKATALQYAVFPFNMKNREQPDVESIKFVEMVILMKVFCWQVTLIIWFSYLSWK